MFLTKPGEKDTLLLWKKGHWASNTWRIIEKQKEAKPETKELEGGGLLHISFVNTDRSVRCPFIRVEDLAAMSGGTSFLAVGLGGTLSIFFDLGALMEARRRASFQNGVVRGATVNEVHVVHFLHVRDKFLCQGINFPLKLFVAVLLLLKGDGKKRLGMPMQVNGLAVKVLPWPG